MSKRSRVLRRGFVWLLCIMLAVQPVMAADSTGTGSGGSLIGNSLEEESSSGEAVPESSESSAEEEVPESSESSAEEDSSESSESASEDENSESSESSSEEVSEAEESSAEEEVSEAEESSSEEEGSEAEESSSEEASESASEEVSESAESESEEESESVTESEKNDMEGYEPVICDSESVSAAYYPPVVMMSLRSRSISNFKNETSIQLINDSDTNIPDRYINENSVTGWNGLTKMGQYEYLGYGNLKVQVDYELADDYEPGELKVTLPKLLTKEDTSIWEKGWSDTYPAYDIGGGDSLWELDASDDDVVVLTNKIKMIKGSSGYFQLKYCNICASYFVDDKWTKEITASWSNASGEFIMKSEESVTVAYIGSQKDYYIKTLVNRSVDYIDILPEDYLPADEVAKYHWTAYEFRIGARSDDAIESEDSYLLITLPKGTKFLNTISTVATPVYTDPESGESLYLVNTAYNYKYCAIGYDTNMYNPKDAVTMVDVKADLILRYKIETDVQRGEDAATHYANEIYASKLMTALGSVPDGKPGWRYMESKTYSKNLSELDFDYGGTGHHPLFCDSAFDAGGTATVSKNDMETEQGALFRYAVTTGISRSYVCDLVFGGDYIYYNTQDSGLVQAGKDEYYYTKATFKTSRLWYAEEGAESSKYSKAGTDLYYNIFYRTAGSSDYRSVYTEKKLIPHDNSQLTVSFDKSQQVIDVQFRIYDIPAGCTVDGDIAFILEGRIKPSAANIDRIIPNTETRQDGKMVFLGYTKVYNSATQEHMDGRVEENFLGTPELDDALIAQDRSLHDNNILYRRKAEAAVKEYFLEGYVRKDMSDAEEDQVNNGWNVQTRLYVDWSEDSLLPNGIAKYTMYDLLPEDLQYLGDEDDISYKVTEITMDSLLSGYTESALSLVDGTVIPAAASAEYVRQHCNFTVQKNYNNTNRIMLKWEFDFSDNPLTQGGEYGLFPVIMVKFDFFIPRASYVKNQGEYTNLAAAMVDVPLNENGNDSFKVVAEENVYRSLTGTDNGQWVGSSDDQDDWKNLDGKEANDDSRVVMGAWDSVSVKNITYAHQNIRKQVQTDLYQEWTDKAVATIGSKYRYKMNVSSSSKYKVGNIVLYDILENEDGSEWKGTFLGIDCSEAETLYDEQDNKSNPDPVVYYATVTNPGLIDSGSWTKAEDFKEDLSKVKAVAIDLRKDKDGNDFYLENSDSFNLYLSLKAPTDPELFDCVTRNTFFAKDIKIVDPYDISNIHFEGDLYTEATAVTIGEKQYSVVFWKLDENKDFLAGAVFILKDENGEVYGEATSGSNGIVRFENVKAGKYTLEEKAAPEGYQKTDDVWTVTVHTDGIDYVSFQKNGENAKRSLFVSNAPVSENKPGSEPESTPESEPESEPESKVPEEPKESESISQANGSADRISGITGRVLGAMRGVLGVRTGAATGDDTSVLPWGIALVAALAAAVVIIVRRKKKK